MGDCNHCLALFAKLVCLITFTTKRSKFYYKIYLESPSKEVLTKKMVKYVRKSSEFTRSLYVIKAYGQLDTISALGITEWTLLA